ncbi:effector-associated constant component EACC1 [Streptomyces sp. NBC_00483]|uniref:effector-associated constant component EACC1 n=1 Tax=Streptomyces sp. NBC_00483 TaxID=2975756 RepID=UPI002E181E99
MEIRFSVPQGVGDTGGEGGEGAKELASLRDWLEDDDELRSAGARVESAYADRPGAMGDVLEWVGVACGAASLAIDVTHSVRAWWRSRGHDGEITFVVRGEDVDRIRGLLHDAGLRDGDRDGDSDRDGESDRDGGASR